MGTGSCVCVSLYETPFSGENSWVNIRLRLATGLVVLLVSAGDLIAGGSGLNVVVVVNQNSTNSVQLGNYYCEKRCVPPQNFLRITNWTGGNVQWTSSDFTNSLLNPLLAMLSSRGLTNQIDYIVLSMDFPYRVVQTSAPSGGNSTTAALFYGFKPDISGDSCSLPNSSSNSYSCSEGIFRQMPPVTAGSNSWLVTMLTSSYLTQAEAIIDRSVAADGTFPTQTVWLAKTTDLARNVRYWEFDDTIFDARVAGDFSIQRTNQNSPYGLTNLFGYQTGLAGFNLLSNAFVPGSIADSLTSFAGEIYENSGQTSLLAFMNAGACSSYGTVVEPCNYLQKFPSPQDYFYQARGFNLAECYYLSLVNPYQGLIVGEPLAAPFARPPSGAWVNLPADSVLNGITNLTLQCTASASNRPVQQVDLFLDGTWLQTLTNLPPAAGNQLYVTINGYTTNYTVPANATIASVAAGLADVLNEPAYTNLSKAQATVFGDRIMLQSTDLNTPGAQIPVNVSNAVGSASALTAFVTASQTNFLDTVAYGLAWCYVSNYPSAGDYLQLIVTKTNGTQVTIAVTNVAPGTNTSGLTAKLLNAINANSSLQMADGLVAGDLFAYEPYGLPYTEFNLYAQTAGWPASQIQIAFTGSPDLVLFPGGTPALDQNVSDLQPRNHLYVRAGATNLLFTFPLDTTALADGSHELTAVAYEGSHVRTQARVTQNVRVQNTSLSATFTTLAGASNTVLNFTLLFSVAANTNTIATIELFTTGGSAGVVSNLVSATFAVAATNLGVGLHPFYAVVTRSDGKQYRTETKWIRIGGSEPPFGLTLTAPPPVIGWPATAGRLYEILSATNLTDTFQLRGSVTPSNSPGLWMDSVTGAPQQFYRVRAP
ncbi:MAG: TIGR03790 family protein [Verrucomicrobiota bacterium]